MMLALISLVGKKLILFLGNAMTISSCSLRFSVSLVSMSCLFGDTAAGLLSSIGSMVLNKVK